MIIDQGQIYLDKEHLFALKREPEYVQKLYQAVARTLAPEPFHIIRKDAARIIKKSLRHFYRILKRFREEGIAGLRLRSRRPKTFPRMTDKELEHRVVQVRKASGFGPRQVADIVFECYRREGRTRWIWPSTVYNILVRRGEIERERRIQNEWRFFEWGHPNRLIQVDLTKFNGVPILTMEDDHSRRGWAKAIPDQKDSTVILAMKSLVRYKYDNLLTDNGSQFSRKNKAMRDYCSDYLNEKHIWTSIHHPQTMGKLSAFQKGLKRFLRHRLGNSRDMDEINHWIEVYVHWYNNGKYHSRIKNYPEERYTGCREENWYDRLVTALKLDEILTV